MLSCFNFRIRHSRRRHVDDLSLISIFKGNNCHSIKNKFGITMLEIQSRDFSTFSVSSTLRLSLSGRRSASVNSLFKFLEFLVKTKYILRTFSLHWNVFCVFSLPSSILFKFVINYVVYCIYRVS
jgi:hypothetical protein